jgi:hypothetical protein
VRDNLVFPEYRKLILTLTECAEGKQQINKNQVNNDKETSNAELWLVLKVFK